MIPQGTTTRRTNWREMLSTKLHRNLKVKAEWNDQRTQLVLQVPTRRPGYLIPPISWVVRPPKYRSIFLDPIGADLWEWCDGNRNVESVIELFAQKHNLTFHESRVSVTTYLKDLVKRGVLAVAI